MHFFIVQKVTGFSIHSTQDDNKQLSLVVDVKFRELVTKQLHA